MLTTYLILSGMLCGVFVMLAKHLPRPAKRLVVAVPAAGWAILVHFGYAGWMGGVTGHMLGALLSVPMYFIIRYYLQPHFAQELADNKFEDSWIYRKIFVPVREFFGTMSDEMQKQAA